MARAAGILTSRGGMTSHAAVVARQMGKPCVAGAEQIEIDVNARTLSANGTTLAQGDWISLDAGLGEVFAGQIATIEPDITRDKELATILSWADEVKRLGVRANADTPGEAKRARELGATGIGLCRTEHMFREEGRPPHVQAMILAAPDAKRGDAAARADLPAGAGASRRVPDRRLLRHPRGDGRLAGHHPPDRSTAARVPAAPRPVAGRRHRGAREGRKPGPSSTKSSAC